MTNKYGKAKKFFEKIALIVVILFGFIGAIITGIVIHEYSHAMDFREVAANSEVCGLVLPTSVKDIMSTKAGYFSFEFNATDDNQKVLQIGKYTEIKAYTFSFLVLLIFIICFAIVTNKEVFSSLSLISPAECNCYRMQLSYSYPQKLKKA